MTGGGPGRATNVLVYEIYNEAFVKFNFVMHQPLRWSYSSSF